MLAPLAIEIPADDDGKPLNSLFAYAKLNVYSFPGTVVKSQVWRVPSSAGAAAMLEFAGDARERGHARLFARPVRRFYRAH